MVVRYVFLVYEREFIELIVETAGPSALPENAFPESNVDKLSVFNEANA